MPLYTFKCPTCGYVEDITLPIALRDDTMFCVKCPEPVVMERVPTTASFTITGFNAKNGYSK